MASNSPFFNCSFDKNRIKALISWSLLNFGERLSLDMVEKFKQIGFQYATQAGASLGLEDLKIPPTKRGLVSQTEFEVQLAEASELQGHLTGIERFQHLIDTWHQTSETLKGAVVEHFRTTDVLNPVYMMAFSGARGNLSQVRQLVGMRGLMADPQGQIISFPIRSNFREGLTLTEYVISCYGARKGLVDTALRTADAGYLTRRLVDVSQHVIVSQFDCKTRRGILMTELKEGNNLPDLSLRDRLVGRVLAENITLDKENCFAEKEDQHDLKEGRTTDRNEERVFLPDLAFASPTHLDLQRENEVLEDHLVARDRFVRQHKTRSGPANPPWEVQTQSTKGKGCVVGHRNQQISNHLADKIATLREKVLIRSPLSCERLTSICQLCYGWSLSEGKLVPLGNAVGIIAAQSIGEPGTQLTMRTFHTGGVFSGDVVNEIRAPHKGTVEFVEPLQGTLIRTSHGKIAFRAKVKGTLTITSPEREETEIQTPPLSILFVKHKEKVVDNQLLAEIPRLSAQIDERVTAKYNLGAQFQGEIFFETLTVTVQTSAVGFVTRSACKLGSVWVLSGKISKGPTLGSDFSLRVGDLVDQKTILNRLSSSVLWEDLVLSIRLQKGFTANNLFNKPKDATGSLFLGPLSGLQTGWPANQANQPLSINKGFVGTSNPPLSVGKKGATSFPVYNRLFFNRPPFSISHPSSGFRKVEPSTNQKRYPLWANINKGGSRNTTAFVLNKETPIKPKTGVTGPAQTVKRGLVDKGEASLIDRFKAIKRVQKEVSLAELSIVPKVNTKQYKHKQANPFGLPGALPTAQTKGLGVHTKNNCFYTSHPFISFLSKSVQYKGSGYLFSFYNPCLAKERDPAACHTRVANGGKFLNGVVPTRESVSGESQSEKKAPFFHSPYRAKGDNKHQQEFFLVRSKGKERSNPGQGPFNQKSSQDHDLFFAGSSLTQGFQSVDLVNRQPYLQYFPSQYIRKTGVLNQNQHLYLAEDFNQGEFLWISEHTYQVKTKTLHNKERDSDLNSAKVVSLSGPNPAVQDPAFCDTDQRTHTLSLFCATKHLLPNKRGLSSRESDRRGFDPKTPLGKETTPVSLFFPKETLSFGKDNHRETVSLANRLRVKDGIFVESNLRKRPFGLGVAAKTRAAISPYNNNLFNLNRKWITKSCLLGFQTNAQGEKKRLMSPINGWLTGSFETDYKTRTKPLQAYPIKDQEGQVSNQIIDRLCLKKLLKNRSRLSKTLLRNPEKIQTNKPLETNLDLFKKGLYLTNKDWLGYLMELFTPEKRSAAKNLKAYQKEVRLTTNRLSQRKENKMNTRFKIKPGLVFLLPMSTLSTNTGLQSSWPWSSLVNRMQNNQTRVSSSLEATSTQEEGITLSKLLKSHQSLFFSGTFLSKEVDFNQSNVCIEFVKPLPYYPTSRLSSLIENHVSLVLTGKQEPLALDLTTNRNRLFDTTNNSLWTTKPEHSLDQQVHTNLSKGYRENPSNGFLTPLPKRSLNPFDGNGAPSLSLASADHYKSNGAVPPIPPSRHTPGGGNGLPQELREVPGGGNGAPPRPSKESGDNGAPPRPSKESGDNGAPPRPSKESGDNGAPPPPSKGSLDPFEVSARIDLPDTTSFTIKWSECHEMVVEGVLLRKKRKGCLKTKLTLQSNCLKKNGFLLFSTPLSARKEALSSRESGFTGSKRVVPQDNQETSSFTWYRGGLRAKGHGLVTNKSSQSLQNNLSKWLKRGCLSFPSHPRTNRLVLTEQPGDQRMALYLYLLFLFRLASHNGLICQAKRLTHCSSLGRRIPRLRESHPFNFRPFLLDQKKRGILEQFSISAPVERFGLINQAKQAGKSKEVNRADRFYNKKEGFFDLYERFTLNESLSNLLLVDNKDSRWFNENLFVLEVQGFERQRGFDTSSSDVVSSADLLFVPVPRKTLEWPTLKETPVSSAIENRVFIPLVSRDGVFQGKGVSRAVKGKTSLPEGKPCVGLRQQQRVAILVRRVESCSLLSNKEHKKALYENSLGNQFQQLEHLRNRATLPVPKTDVFPPSSRNKGLLVVRKETNNTNTEVRGKGFSKTNGLVDGASRESDRRGFDPKTNTPVSLSFPKETLSEVALQDNQHLKCFVVSHEKHFGLERNRTLFINSSQSREMRLFESFDPDLNVFSKSSLRFNQQQTGLGLVDTGLWVPPIDVGLERVLPSHMFNKNPTFRETALSCFRVFFDVPANSPFALGVGKIESVFNRKILDLGKSLPTLNPFVKRSTVDTLKNKQDLSDVTSKPSRTRIVPAHFSGSALLGSGFHLHFVSETKPPKQVNLFDRANTDKPGFVWKDSKVLSESQRFREEEVLKKVSLLAPLFPKSSFLGVIINKWLREAFANKQIKGFLKGREVERNPLVGVPGVSLVKKHHLSTPKTSNTLHPRQTKACYTTSGADLRLPFLTSFLSPYIGEIAGTKNGSTWLLLTSQDQTTYRVEKGETRVCVGQFVRYGKELSSGQGSTTSGQVVEITGNKVTLRRGQPVLFSSESKLYVNARDFVEKKALLLTFLYQKLITGDIVQGIPKIEQLFEVRDTKDGEPIPNSLLERLFEFFECYQEEALETITDYQRFYLRQKIAVRKSLKRIQLVLVGRIQRVYLSQGVLIADKHLEVVVRQMTSKVQITRAHPTKLVRDELIDLRFVEEYNIINWEKGGVHYQPAILGITQASLEARSFLSAASFQETTKVLSQATIQKRRDLLGGLKQKVIVGDLINVGTTWPFKNQPKPLLTKQNNKGLFVPNKPTLGS